MSKNNSPIKNLTQSHGWLGVVFSIFLFIIFWCGSLSLFRAEIEQWAELPHYPITSQGEDKSLSEIVSPVLKQHSVDNRKTISVSMPSENNLHYTLRGRLKTADPEQGKPGGNVKKETDKQRRSERIKLKIDPKTGQAYQAKSQFELIDFIYRLHYNLQMSRAGLYFLGLVTLFFLFALLSGVYIHAKKIVNYFFTYRNHKTRPQLLDMHNIIGVMSLPFTLMYAITGLIFNLIVVYQVAFVVFVYQGDKDEMMVDAGFLQFTPEPAAKQAMDMQAADKVVKDIQQKYGPASFLRLYNYGDYNAVIQFFGQRPANFAPRYKIHVRVRDGAILKQSGLAEMNNFRQGRSVLSSLHFGNFAGFDLRVLYFILGLAVTAMMIIGNMLWINKRRNNRKVSDKVTDFVSNLTLGVCCGMILATTTGLLAERVMPTNILARADWVIGVFLLTNLAMAIYSFCIQDKKRFIATTLYSSAIALFATLISSWAMFSSTLLQLWSQGVHSVIGVEVGLLLAAITCLLTAYKVNPQLTTAEAQPA